MMVSAMGKGIIKFYIFTLPDQGSSSKVPLSMCTAMKYVPCNWYHSL